ncbi:tetratricopeptide repeat protein [Shewanella abyssi]|uniref:tetratricopeptide repeat protein n=1 Tax=Shewanella abyssi TaxID=311789 RepID=UPI00200DCEB6|nr:tetratricopeptide repeat protein [Shewanella abyssi]MCL1049245.1 tetratricopeptide repeat protein [Shewanella abyssi]
MQYLLLVVCLIVSGCQSTQKQRVEAPKMPTPDYQVDVTAYEIPEPEDLLTLTATQIEKIEHFIQQSDISTLSANDQVGRFVGQRLVNFNYEGQNYSASTALTLNRGNCMSLALLTYAIAEQLKVDVNFQVMHTMPMLLDVTDRYAVTSDHVRTFLYEPSLGNERTFFSGKKRITVDYFPERYDRGGKVIGKDEFIAMFYRNLAADELINNNLPLAYLLLKKSFDYSQYYAPSINMMAVVLRRLGFDKDAERLYLYGLEVSDDKVTLLSNYHYLLVRQGRTVDALMVKKQLLELDDSSPYKWYLVAKDSIAKEDYQSAKIYLSKFIDNTHYFHKAYFDLAKVHTKLGETEQAKSALLKALDYAAEPVNKQRYQAKLAWLRSR